jgi:hypothetical protein
MFINCPKCGIMIEVLELNCRIFRCGVYKSNGEQLPPHHPMEDCMRVASEDLIYGCGAAFRICKELSEDGSLIADICDYI